MSSRQHPTGLNEDPSADVAEGSGGANRPGLQGRLPWMSTRKRLLPPKDSGWASGLRLPTLGELGGCGGSSGSSGVGLRWSQICLVDGWWGGWSWQGWRDGWVEGCQILKPWSILCMRVFASTSGAFAHVTIVPLEFVVSVDETPRLLIAIRVPAQRFSACVF